MVLQKYKLRPWIMRQNGASSTTSISKRVTIVIEKVFSEFDAHDEEILRHALASFLQIPIDSIGIIGKREGSIQILVELPADAVDRLLKAFRENDPRLKEQLPIFPLKDIRAESSWIPESSASEDQVSEAVSALETSAEAAARKDYEERFERVFEDRYPVVLLFFTRKGIAAEVARDLAQETFLRLYRAGSSKSEEELDSLIFGIAREVYRATERKDGSSDKDLSRERQRALKDALEELPSQMRQAASLRFAQAETQRATLHNVIDIIKAKLFVSRLIERKLPKLSNDSDHK